MRPHLCHRLSDSVLFEFGTIPESRVNRGSGFLRGGEVYLGGRGMLGRVWFAETSGCLVRGLVSRQPNR